jgi:hypothetical protein
VLGCMAAGAGAERRSLRRRGVSPYGSTEPRAGCHAVGRGNRASSVPLAVVLPAGMSEGEPVGCRPTDPTRTVVDTVTDATHGRGLAKLVVLLASRLGIDVGVQYAAARL